MSVNTVPHKMNCIPGFDASEGERIHKAIIKLMGTLDQVKFSRRESQNHSDFDEGIYNAIMKLQKSLEHITKQATFTENNSNSKSDFDEGMALAHVKLKIAYTQILYLRSIVRENLIDKEPFLRARIGADTEKAIETSNVTLPTYEDETKFKQTSIYDKDTQTDNSPVRDFSSYNKEDRSVSTAKKTADHLEHSDASVSVTQNSKINTRPHYHLNLTDVPFILGQSCGKSHSVVANVQSLINIMKFHNKTLCDVKPHTSSSSARTQNALENFKLPKGSSGAALDKRNLKGCLINKEKEPEAKSLNKNTAKNVVKEISKKRNSDIKVAKSNSNEQAQHIIPTNKISKHFVSRSAKCSLMRSIQNCKTHLITEDVSWI